MTTQTHTPVIRVLSVSPATTYPVKLDALSRAAIKRMNRARMQQRVEKAIRALRFLGVNKIPMGDGASRFVQGMAAGVVLAASAFLFAAAVMGMPS